MYATLTNFIRGLSKEEYLALAEMCRYSNNLYNAALYSVRQYFFENEKYLKYEGNYHICKNNDNYKLLQASVAQQTMKVVDRCFQSFFSLKEKVKKGEYQEEVKIPHYRKKGDLFNLIIPSSSITIKNGKCLIPMSLNFRKLHPGIKIWVPVPDRIKEKRIKEVHILPLCDGKYFKIQYIYIEEGSPISINCKNIMAIDVGVDNLASCVTTLGTSFIMDGRYLKSINQGWNKRKAYLMSIANRQGMTSTHQLKKIALKRNNRCKDIMYKTVRYIVDYCIDNDIGTVVVGYSPKSKQNTKLGKKNNQAFCSIPFSDFRRLLKNKCNHYGIQYIEQEESYTSKSSFLDDDALPVYNSGTSNTEKFSGKRVHRGLYKSKDGTTVNADLNGAANILRKTGLDYDKEGLKKAVLSRPQRIKLI